MAYFLDLFTPETWRSFQVHGSTVSGFRHRQRKAAEQVQVGDIFCCYLVRLSRWCGLLEVTSDSYSDASPIFSDPDPFVVRFKVKPLVMLGPEHSVPIGDDRLWPHLSFTRELALKSVGWAQFAGLRSSLRRISGDDGEIISAVLKEQNEIRRLYPLTGRDEQLLSERKTVTAADRTVLVEVPVDAPDDEAPPEHEVATDEKPDFRTSLKMQALLARIGIEMGFRVWIPRNDKQAVLDQIAPSLHGSFLNQLPLNYDDVTLKTIEQIDAIWMRNRSMARAFEVEHTTAIYSGLLRMADLLALQPNMDIRLHIVAPDDKRAKVLREIKRPVFSLLDRGPLYENCSFLSYSSIEKISGMGHLQHMSDTLIEEFEEFPADD
ncbi:hypothetical protein HU675_0016305 [Bradyrhizobium septentrionale]|uniref:hypothetical protein n=1 Tax=Bradyrhizobium septentrionale TaxID=1404411 RepID=UPI001596D3F5|nr:hypothetical protein [Bradyrhizobium septentrionale]UGY28192.1 hypothetical protein HU675_0016305 [Bradyrhizobium septentrionale]